MPDGVVEERQSIRIDKKEIARDLFQHVSGPRPVKKIGAVIQAAGVVEDGEEADQRFVSAGFLAELEANRFYSLPVVGAVN